MHFCGVKVVVVAAVATYIACVSAVPTQGDGGVAVMRTHILPDDSETLKSSRRRPGSRSASLHRDWTKVPVYEFVRTRDKRQSATLTIDESTVAMHKKPVLKMKLVPFDVDAAPAVGPSGCQLEVARNEIAVECTASTTKSGSVEGPGLQLVVRPKHWLPVGKFYRLVVYFGTVTNCHQHIINDFLLTGCDPDKDNAATTRAGRSRSVPAQHVQILHSRPAHSAHHVSPAVASHVPANAPRPGQSGQPSQIKVRRQLTASEQAGATRIERYYGTVEDDWECVICYKGKGSERTECEIISNHLDHGLNPELAEKARKKNAAEETALAVLRCPNTSFERVWWFFTQHSGHVYHLQCLETWMESDPSCPKCRHPVNC